MTNISRRDFNRLLGTSVIAAGIQLPSGAFAQTPVKGGTLRVAVADEQPSFIDLFGNGAIPAVQGELVSLDFDLKPRPSIATSWEIGDDGKSYTFKLRENVKWHDGTPFTSKDVAYSIMTLKKTHPRRQNTFANVTAVETPDDHTAKFVLSSPAPYLLGALSGVGTALIPRHLYEGTDLKTNPYNRKPIGVGPFVFKEWVQGSHYILERNPDYWNAPKPYLDRIIVRVIPDTGARSAAFEANEIDFGTQSPIAYNDVDRLVATGNFGVETRGYELGGNLHQLFFNLDNPILKNLKVRQAVAHSIDIDKIIKIVWNGYAIPSPGAIVPDMKQFHDPSIKPYAFDTALAEKLLDEAGYPRNGDKRFSLKLTWNPGMRQQQLAAEYIRSALSKVGIDVEILSFEFSTYIKKVYTDRVFDIDVQNLNNGYDPTDGINRAYLSSNIKKGLPWSNHTHYANPEVDHILTAAASEGDETKRRDLYFKFQEIVYRDLPAVNFVQFQRLTIFNKRVHDHTTGASRLGAEYHDATYLSSQA